MKSVSSFSSIDLQYVYLISYFTYLKKSGETSKSSSITIVYCASYKEDRATFNSMLKSNKTT